MLKNGILACALFRFYWKITGWGTPFEKPVEIKKKRMPKCFFWAWPSTAKFNFWKKFHTGRKSKKNTALKIDWFLLCLNGLFRGIVRRVPESVYRFFVFGRFPFGFPIVRIRQNIQNWIHKWAKKRSQNWAKRELTSQEIFQEARQLYRPFWGIPSTQLESPWNSAPNDIKKSTKLQKQKT